MRKIKLLSVLAVLCTAVFVVNLSSAAAAKAVDPKETVINACRNTEKLANCHVDFDFAVSFPQGINWLFSQGNNLDISVKGEYDAQAKPMLAKMNINFLIKDGLRKFEQEFPVYVEETENEMIVYCNNNNQWIKQSLPKVSDDYQSEDYLTAIKNVALKSEDANVRVFEVTIDVNYIKEKLRQNPTIAKMPEAKKSFNMLDNIDDFTYLVTIDKKTANISKIEMDLSGLVSKVVNNIAEAQGGTIEQKNRFKEMFANVKMTGTMTFSKFNDVGTITIPEEVKTKAKVMSQMENKASLPPVIKERSPVVYPAEAWKQGLEGKVLLKVNVSDTGTVTDVEIIQSSGYEMLDNAATESVAKWRFLPAKKNGEAVAGNISVPIEFRIAVPGLLNPQEILNIQRKLNELGFDCGEPDGVIGPKTEQSIKDFQQSRGLTPNGIVGYETKKALGI